MITLAFILLMIAVFGRLAIFAIKATWGFTKVLFTIIFFPAILIIVALTGGIFIALPILAIVGIISLFVKRV